MGYPGGGGGLKPWGIQEGGGGAKNNEGSRRRGGGGLKPWGIQEGGGG